jgi:hypothetical protein
MVNVREAGCLDYPKFVLSALLLIFSTVCTFYAIIEKKTRWVKEWLSALCRLSFFPVPSVHCPLSTVLT